MNSKQTEADYVPYGPEWEKEMSKFPKLQLIKMLGKAYQEKKELKQSLPSNPVGDVEENPMWELWKQDKIPDLTDATPEQKANMVNGLIETMAKETLKLFKALGLKTHIESKVINDPTGEVFNFSFTKSGYAAASLPSKPVGEDATVTEQEMSSLRWLLNVSSEKPKTQLFTALDNCCDKEGISHRTHLENLWNKIKSGYAAAPQKGMRWVKVSDTKPKENSRVIFRWTDTGYVFRRTIKSLRDENGNIGGLFRLEWLDESPSPSEAGDGWGYCNQCGGKLSEVRGRYPKQPKRKICPTCAIEELESIKQNNLTAKNNKDEQYT